MKPWKLAQVARIRSAVAHLRTHPHATHCPCCTDLLDLIESASDSVCAQPLLTHCAHTMDRRTIDTNREKRRSD